jgi:hypothetical protein
MKDKGILSSEKQGKNIFYSLQLTAIADIFPILEQLEINS